jgi:hypothetical protein
MLFKIRGTDGQGRKREISIDAPSEAEAVRRVKEMGILVGATEGLANKAPSASSAQYLAISTYATVLRIIGWITIAAGVVAGVYVAFAAAGEVRFVTGAGLVIAGIICGVGQLAFAELLGLFVRLEANTQYMCNHMYALEQQQRAAKPSNPAR